MRRCYVMGRHQFLGARRGFLHGPGLRQLRRFDRPAIDVDYERGNALSMTCETHIFFHIILLGNRDTLRTIELEWAHAHAIGNE